MPDERWTFLNMNDQADKQTEPYRFFGTQEEGIVGKRDLSYDDAPIGVFDSGFGGLTVAREIMKALPHENIIYFGDTLHCPYGPRSFDEVASFVEQIGTWLVDQGVKMIVIACNTATAAGLSLAQTKFPVPVIGVVEPGARAAARATRNKRVGVIATKGTMRASPCSQQQRLGSSRSLSWAFRWQKDRSRTILRLLHRSIFDQNSKRSRKTISTHFAAVMLIRSYWVAPTSHY